MLSTSRAVRFLAVVPYSLRGVRVVVVRHAVVMVTFAVCWAAMAQAPWNLSVCADPENSPASSRNQDGFENKIAEILAEQLGARLEYFWTPINNVTVRRHLESGDCDLVMSVGEGAMGLLNTVAYYRVPYVFLFKTGSGVEVKTMYDESLGDLRIAAMPNTAVHAALFDLGLVDNYVGINPNVAVRGPGRIAPTVEALLAGQVDVAIVPGAAASVYVKESGGILTMVPVQPELFPPLTPMFQMSTIGVRAHDEGLRDALNRALAERWQDVQQVFFDLGVPILPSAPVSVGQVASDVFRVGVVAPYPTSFPKPMDETAESVYFGARLADDLAFRGEGREGFNYEMIYANAPSTAAAERAIDRLVALNGIEAIVVGLDDDATLAIAGRAAQLDVLLLNVLSPNERLRDPTCFPTTFNVAPSLSMYTEAMVGQALMVDPVRVVVVSTLAEDSAGPATQAKTRLEGLGVEVLSLVVEEGPVFALATLREITASRADAVLAFLEPAPQEMFLSEMEREGFAQGVVGFPWPAMQTRSFYYRLGQVAPDLMSFPRIAGWEATLVTDGADEINQRFVGRSGRAMDVTAWSTFAAIDMAIGAGVGARGTLSGALSDELLGSMKPVATGKGVATSLDSASHQFLQPIYLVQVHPEVPWSEAVGGRLDIASLVGPLAPVPQAPVRVSPGSCD